MVKKSKVEEAYVHDESACAIFHATPFHALHDGFGKDEWAKQTQAFQKRSHLITGKPPLMNDVVEVSVTAGSSWFRISGRVTHIFGPPTTPETLAMSSAACFGSHLAEMGAVHGQKVSALAVVNFDFHHKRESAESTPSRRMAHFCKRPLHRVLTSAA